VSRRALVIQHEEPTPPGLITPWLGERGYEVETLRIDEQDPHDLDPRAYELIVSLGSEFGAYQDDIEWIKHEMDFLAEAQEADVPILGVCFGGQILARVLGGDVFRRTRKKSAGSPWGRAIPTSFRTVRGFSGTSTRSLHLPAQPSWRQTRPGHRPTSSDAASVSVPSRGDDGDHGRVGARLQARAR
jgi:hypothetical protein